MKFYIADTLVPFISTHGTWPWISELDTIGQAALGRSYPSCTENISAKLISVGSCSYHIFIRWKFIYSWSFLKSYSKIAEKLFGWIAKHRVGISKLVKLIRVRLLYLVNKSPPKQKIKNPWLALWFNLYKRAKKFKPRVLFMLRWSHLVQVLLFNRVQWDFKIRTVYQW